MIFPTSLGQSEQYDFEFIEAGPDLPRVLDEVCDYSGLLKIDNFDAESYFAEFQLRCRMSQPVGAYRFRDADVTNGWMLISKNECELVYNLLPGMGWDKTHLDQVLADESFRSVQTQPERRQRLPGKYVVLGCPGVFTYGHFLVDISIRIQLVKEMALHAGAKYLIPAPTHPWQLAILEVAGISPDDCVAVGNADSFQLEEMLVPVVTGLNGVLNRVLAQRTFRRMKEVMNNIAGPKSSERSLIFPLHTTMSSVHHPRGVEQRDLIVRTLQKDFGVEAFDPLQLSFAQQVDKFRNARLVVGEDSSALHNILWSDGADLAVMAPKGQFNYYHIGLQAIDGGRTAILWGDVTDQERGRFQMNLDSLCTTVEGLLREHRAPEFDIPLIAGSSH